MQTLLEYLVIVEPDRQRLIRFVLEAVGTLNGNRFAATASLTKLLGELRHAAIAGDAPLEVRLQLEDRTMFLCWDDRKETILLLAVAPAEQDVALLSRHLGEQTRLADPELLMQRNEQIRKDLERAKEHADRKMQELMDMTTEMETLLEEKKNELKVTMLQAETDSLTGLFNRGGFDKRLQEAIQRCQRQEDPMTLILLDLDNFKVVNDSKGHQFGDEYLQRAAKIIRDSCREHVDHPCRIGGDEFAIIIFTAGKVAKRVARDVLIRMECQISIGLSELLEHDTPATLVARADAALYRAKDNGRGQVMVAEEQETNVRFA